MTFHLLGKKHLHFKDESSSECMFHGTWCSYWRFPVFKKLIVLSVHAQSCRPSHRSLSLSAARCCRIWHLWELQGGRSMGVIVRHVVYLLFTACMFEEEFDFAGKREQDLDIQLQQAAADRTPSWRRWGPTREVSSLKMLITCRRGDESFYLIWGNSHLGVTLV